ncbi:MAG: haloalkane dehalogenase [Myxococcota bacterium]
MRITLTLSLCTALLAGCGDDDASTDPPVDATVDAPPVVDAAPIDTAPPPDGDCFAELEVRTTPSGVRFVRTPDSCFEALPNWDYAPRYVAIDGLRQHYVDEGPTDGPVILLLHGQPAWSYLYRFMIPPLVDAGFRVIAMDHVGMGRSDKPIEERYHSFDNHVQRLQAFIAELSLEGATLFCQDWGSIIGLWTASLDLDLFARIIMANGGIPDVQTVSPRLETGIEENNANFLGTLQMIPENQPSFFDEDGNSLLPVGGDEGGDAFSQWLTFAFTYDATPWVGLMHEALTFDALTPDEEAAYDAPFPSRVTMMAPRTFPGLRNELIGRARERLEALEGYERPFLTVFGGNDPGLVGEGDGQQEMIDRVPGAAGQDHVRLPNGSHFLQDDIGAEIAQRVIAFIRSN